MRKVKVPRLGTVLHPGTKEEVDRHQKFVTARMTFVLSYCQERCWPVPGEPDFEKRITMEQVLEIRDQPGWKDPLQDGNPVEMAVLLERDGAVILPKGCN